MIGERELIREVPPLHGPGLHGGRLARLEIRPAPAGSGLVFVRRDSSPEVRLPVGLERAVPRDRCSAIAMGSVQVQGIEHVLGALSGLCIFDAELHLWGEEIPILDGSAAPFAARLLAHSRPCPIRPRCSFRVRRARTLVQGTSLVQLLPHDGHALECSLEFPQPVIGQQVLHAPLHDPDWFMRRLAPARTFGFIEDAARLRAQGLIRGAAFSHALVLSQSQVLNEGGSRFSDEAVRHKVLDAMGDLMLLGGPLTGRVRLRRHGHRLLQRCLVQALLDGTLARL